jgi:hypothetical protein
VKLMSPMPKLNARRRGLVISVAVLLMMTGAAMFAAGATVPPQRLAQKLHRDEGETPAIAQARRILIRARLMGVVYLLGGAVVLARSASIANWLEHVNWSIARMSVRARRELKRWMWSRDALVVGVLIVVGLALRLEYVREPIRFDEAVTFLFFVARGPVTILASYSANNHVLQNLLAWVSTKVLGPTPQAMRVSTVMAGMMLIPLAYVVGRAVWNRSAGVLAASLVAVLPYFVFLSVNARGYAIMLCCTAGCMTLCPSLRRRNAWALWLVFALLAAVGMFAILTMVYPVLVLGAWLAALSFERSAVPRGVFLMRAAGAALLGAAMFVALYTPAMIKSGLLVMLNNKMTAGLPRQRWLAEAVGWPNHMWSYWARPLPAMIGIALVVLVVAEVLWRHGRRVWLSPIVLLALVFPAVVFCQSVYIHPRVGVFAWLMLLCSAAAAVAMVGRPILANAVAVAAVVYFGWITAFHDGANFAESGRLRDAPAMAAMLKQTSPRDGIVFSYMTRRPLEYYFHVSGAPPAHVNRTADPDGVTWVVVDDEVALATALAQANVARASDNFAEYRRFPWGARIYRERK